MTTIPALETVIGRLMDKDQASVFALLDIATERLRQITAEGWTPVAQRRRWGRIGPRPESAFLPSRRRA